MNNQLDSFKLKELIGHSIDSEEKSKQFYKKFVESGKGQLVPGRFKSLMEDEELHKETLLDLHEKIYGNKDYIVPESENLPPHEDFDKLDNVVNLIDALNKAIKNEHNAIEVYEYLADEYDKYSQFFNYLVSMEYGHYESLIKEKKLYEKQPSEDQPERTRQSVWDNLGLDYWIR